MRSRALIAATVTVFIAVVAVILYTKLLVPQEDLPVPVWAISFGAPTAPITLIELFDLHCPYCAMAHEQLDPLYRQLIAEGKLRLVFVDLIVHPQAVVSHQHLHCAYKQLGEKTYDLLTELYKAYLKGGPEKQLEMLKQYKCADAPTIRDFEHIKNEWKGVLGQRIGTPTFVIIKNGTINVVVGADVAKVVSLLSQ